MKEISKGNTNCEKVVTGQFISSVPEDILSLFAAIKRQNITGLSRVAHNMKTSVAIMGLLPLLEELQDQLENALEISPTLYGVTEKIQAICKVAVEEAKDFRVTLIDKTV